MNNIYFDGTLNDKVAEIITTLRLINTKKEISAIITDNGDCVHFYKCNGYALSIAAYSQYFTAYDKTTAITYAKFKSLRRAAKYVIAERWLRAQRQELKRQQKKCNNNENDRNIQKSD